MRERPIIFDAESVRAILDGSKSQTRRVIKPQPETNQQGYLCGWWLRKPLGGLLLPKIEDIVMDCPYGAPGDRLWVREKFAYEDAPLDRPGMVKVHYDYSVAPYTADWFPMPDTGIRFRYNSQGVRGSTDGVWRSPIHMPRWASRIRLEVTGVRVERLQDISEADICAELGIPEKWPGPGPEPYERQLHTCWAARWNAINGKRGYGWDANPYIWCISFRRIDDAVA